MLRNTQGIHMPLRLQMERNVAVKVGRSQKSTYKIWIVFEILPFLFIAKGIEHS